MRVARAVTLDLDDTLLDGAGLERSVARTCEAICDVVDGLEPAALRAANATAWPGYWAEVGERWVLGELDGPEFNAEAWRRSLAACGCTDPAVVAATAELHRRFAREEHRLFDDAEALFECARALSIPLALVTNGASGVQRDKLDVLGIESHFATVVVSGELGAAKPDPVIFERALAALGVDARDAWHVGDTLAYDVLGATRAGMGAVWVNRHGIRPAPSDPTPDVEVTSLAAICELLRALHTT